MIQKVKLLILLFSLLPTANIFAGKGSSRSSSKKVSWADISRSSSTDRFLSYQMNQGGIPPEATAPVIFCFFMAALHHTCPAGFQALASVLASTTTFTFVSYAAYATAATYQISKRTERAAVLQPLTFLLIGAISGVAAILVFNATCPDLYTLDGCPAGDSELISKVRI